MKKQIIFLLVIFMYASTAYSQQTSTLWSEDFEGNWSSDWYADLGVWQVGTPTIGPVGAHEGTNCATVGLTSNYPSTINSRLIRNATFIVPDSAQNPRLRFWHWWVIAYNDYGCVQIKENGSSNWVDISPHYTGVGGNIWNYALIDLTPYAGKTVQIAFFFHAQPYDENPGWYVDDISIETGPITSFFPENFEGDWMKSWYSDWGVWQVGLPTIGPVGSHGGSNCATVGLTSNYPSTFNSRLIRNETFTVPDSVQNPRLRFWHWWVIAYNDYGCVQIKEKGSSNWVDISPRYTGVGGNIWNYAFIDLTPYAGKAVQIAFFFHAQPYDENPGWYIDDISIETGPITSTFPENFESDWMKSWYSDWGVWQVGKPSIGPLGAHGGINCATIGLTSNYPSTFNSRLIRNATFVVPDSVQNPRLRFWHWWVIAYNDYGCVQIKENGSSSWVDISPHYTGVGGNNWNYALIDLNPYAGKTVQIAFLFHAQPYDENPGWYIDDVELEYTRQSDVGIYKIIYPKGIIKLDTVITPKALIKNFGLNPETFTAKFFLDTVNISSVGNITLLPSQSDTLSFPNWTATPEGTYNTKFQTFLPGDEDFRNDSLCNLLTIISGLGPEIYSITPNHGGNSGSIKMIINGKRFLNGITAKLTRPGYPDIVADTAGIDWILRSN